MRRIESVDVFRLCAIVAVICIHTAPFGAQEVQSTPLLRYLSLLINQVSRFAVPFFFVISGYFWGRRVRDSGAIWGVSRGMIQRIAMVLAVWSVVYLLPYNLAVGYEQGWTAMARSSLDRWTDTAHHPWAALWGGTKPHLWFLSALVSAIVITAILVAQRSMSLLVGVSAVLYGVGVLAKAYTETPWGLHLSFDTRNGPFFATALFATGYGLSGWQPRASWMRIGLMLFVGGCAMHFAEMYLLWLVYGANPYQDYFVGTYFMGVGTGMLALSGHRVLQCSQVSQVGQFTLGIYAIHFIFVDWFRPLSMRLNSPLWEVSYVVLVFVLSLGTVRVLAKSELLRKVVT